MKPEYQEAVDRVRSALRDEDRLPQYRGMRFPVGHCYVACEVVHALVPNLKPATCSVNGVVHWVLIDPRDGSVVDPTADQWTVDIRRHYATLRRRGFLTKGPSKRAQRVLARLTEGRMQNGR